MQATATKRGDRRVRAGESAPTDTGDDIDLKHVAEQPRPGLSPRLRSQDGPIVLEERELLRPLVLELRHDLRAQFAWSSARRGSGSCDSVYRPQGIADGGGDQRCEPRTEVERFEHEGDHRRASCSHLRFPIAVSFAARLASRYRGARGSTVTVEPGRLRLPVDSNRMRSTRSR